MAINVCGADKDVIHITTDSSCKQCATKEEFDALSEVVDGINEDLSTVNGKVSNLEECCEEAKTNIENLTEEVDSLEECCADVQTALEQMEITGTSSGAIASFDDGADGKAVKSLTVDINPVQSGTGEPSPTNVRPISGWTGAEVVRCGINLLPSEAQDISNWNAGTSTTGGYRFYKCNIPHGSYTVFSPHNVPYNNSLFMRAMIVDASGNRTGYYLYHATATGENRNKVTLTIPQGGYLQLEAYGTVGDAFTNNLWISTDENASYEPYNGTTYPITWSDTVYGGALDVTSGVLTVDRAMVDLGTLNWVYNTGGLNEFISDGIQSTVRSNENLICSQYTRIESPTSSGISNADMAVAINKKTDGMTWTGYFALGVIVVKDSRFTDATSFKTAMSGVQLCYELATPTTIQLTSTEVTTLLGSNNIYADTGDVDVVYVRDLNLVINKLLNQ